MELAWLAGLIEGEGTLRLRASRHGHPYPAVQVGMTDEDVIRRALAVSGVGHVTGPYTWGRRKPLWLWQVNRQADAAALIMTLYGFFGRRRQEQARAVLGAWRQEPLRYNLARR